jgi:membrane-associated protease RseP (regulator of RpoE activity)
MRRLVCGFAALALAGFVLGGAARAEDQKKDGKDDKKEKKADKPAVPDMPLPDFDKLLQGFGGLSDEQRKELTERMKQMGKMFQQMQKQQGGFPGGDGLFGPGGLGGGMPLFPAIPLGPNARRATSAQESRLGAKLGEPSAALIDQLDLPKGQGMVLQEVGPNSPAAKAGLKANDILLEVDGKPVSTAKGEFDRTLADVKADQAVEVVVMRKGKKETLKGLKLPEAARAVPAPRPKLLPNLPRLPGGLGLLGGVTTVARNNDEFTTKHVADGVTFVVKGTIDQGKAEASEITIDDGKASTYAGLDKVPAEHQETVKKLIQLSGGRGLRLPLDRQ